MSRGCLKCLSGLVTAMLLAACSSVAYSPRPARSGRERSRVPLRSGDVDGLKQFAAANGYAAQDWPPQQWGLKELTLVALYFHSDIRTARARADVAHAELGSATQATILVGTG